MSTDNFRHFYNDVVEKDEGLKEKLRASETPAEFMKIAGPHAEKGGYDFSAEDVMFVLFGGELDESDLAGVAGGVSYMPRMASKDTNPGGTCRLFSSAGNCCNDW